MGHKNIAKSRGETQAATSEERRRALELALRVIAHSHQDLEEAEMKALRKAVGPQGEEDTSLRAVAIQVAADAILGEGLFAGGEQDEQGDTGAGLGGKTTGSGKVERAEK